MIDGRFFGHFFWKVKGTVRIHITHVQLPYTVINMQDGQGANNGKLGKFRKFQIVIKVAGRIASHIGSLIWQPS